MQIIAVCVASDYKDWDTYHPSSTYAYNTSLSEETDETPFFLTYGHKPVTLPNVALLTPMIQSKSEDSYQEQLIGLIRTAWQLAAKCTQQAQQCMDFYYDQHAKDHHPFR